MKITLLDGTSFYVGAAPIIDGRRHWRYIVTAADGITVLATGTDLATAADDPEEALTALLGFLSAWLDAPDGELAGMFPDTCRTLDADLIAIAVAEREETE